MPAESFNASVYLLDRQVEAGRGGHTAVTGPAGSASYAELAGQVAVFAAGLASLGIRPEERVLIAATDCPEHVVTFLALLRLGAIAVPVSTMYNGTELGELLRDTRARVVVASAEFAGAAREAIRLAPEAHTLVLIGEEDPAGRDGMAAGEVVAWADVLAVGQRLGPAAPYDTWFDSPGFWLYTSGTTGTPKAAMHRHGGIARVCEGYAHQVLGITAADRCYSVAKLFFAGPAFFAALLAADVPASAFASVRLATSAGEALPAEIYRRFTSRYGVDIIDGLGSTEALHIFISNRPGAVHPGTSGTLVPGYDARIVDDAGEPVPDGQPGRLLVRGDSIASGYWCRTATTRQVFQGEWLRTGDTYSRSADGVYTCLGRTSDLIKAGGIWVSPTEVESRLVQHEAVAECAVVGHRDADGLEEVVACVVPMPGTSVDGDELIAFCRAGLAAFKRPRQVLVLDGLPKTATGKIQRVVVRDIAAGLLGK